MRFDEKFPLQARMDPAVVRAVDRISVEWGTSRAGALDRLLREAIDRYVVESGWPWVFPA